MFRIFLVVFGMWRRVARSLPFPRSVATCCSWLLAWTVRLEPGNVRCKHEPGVATGPSRRPALWVGAGCLGAGVEEALRQRPHSVREDGTDEQCLCEQGQGLGQGPGLSPAASEPSLPLQPPGWAQEHTLRSLVSRLLCFAVCLEPGSVHTAWVVGPGPCTSTPWLCDSR